MTDNEIIKALERTASWVCDECKFHGEMCDGDKCEKVVAENALDLINCQKAEIERLNEKITAKDENNYYFMGQLRLAREKLLIAKSEAIKEFAERLKDNYCFTDRWGKIIPKSTVDNLVKEMTEVEK